MEGLAIAKIRTCSISAPICSYSNEVISKLGITYLFFAFQKVGNLFRLTILSSSPVNNFLTVAF